MYALAPELILQCILIQYTNLRSVNKLIIHEITLKATIVSFIDLICQMLGYSLELVLQELKVFLGQSIEFESDNQ